jgi:hypothetical protein
MSLLIYAITAGDGPPPAGTGLEQQPLHAVEHAGLRAVVSRAPGELTAQAGALIAYERVVERLATDSHALLPARFGITATGEGELRGMLQARAPALWRALDGVRGAVEFAVRGTPDPGPAARPASGREYMERLLGRERSEQQLAADLAGLFRSRRRVRRGSGAAAYLVDERHVTDFVQRLRSLGATVTGPWPPYSFVEIEAP